MKLVSLRERSRRIFSHIAMTSNIETLKIHTYIRLCIGNTLQKKKFVAEINWIHVSHIAYCMLFSFHFPNNKQHTALIFFVWRWVCFECYIMVEHGKLTYRELRKEEQRNLHCIEYFSIYRNCTCTFHTVLLVWLHNSFTLLSPQTRTKFKQRKCFLSLELNLRLQSDKFLSSGFNFYLPRKYGILFAEWK